MTDAAAANDVATSLSAIEDELASPQMVLGDPDLPLAPHGYALPPRSYLPLTAAAFGSPSLICPKALSNMV